MKRRFFLLTAFSAAAAWIASLLGERRSIAARRSPTTTSTASEQPDRPAYTDNFSRCVLCGKSREQAKKLILGKHGGVCLDCVDLCQDIIRTDAGRKG